MQKIDKTVEIKKQKIEKDTTVNGYTVNSKDKSLSTVNSREDIDQQKTLEEEMTELIKKHGLKKEGVARYIAELLDDVESLRFYEILVKENKTEFLMEWAHYVKDRALQGKIRTKPAIYFQAVIRRHGAKTKFKKT